VPETKSQAAPFAKLFIAVTLPTPPFFLSFVRSFVLSAAVHDMSGHPGQRLAELTSRQKRQMLAMQGPMQHIGATQRTVCHSFEATAANRLVDGSFEFKLPDYPRNTSELALASFECTTVEPTVTAQENAVVWTEGLRLTPGTAPDTSLGFNLFAHELALRETKSDGSYVYFKLGICPALNEISSRLWSSTVWRANGAGHINNSYVYSTTNSQNSAAAAHYVGPFQTWAARPAGMRLLGVCMSTVDEPLDFADADVVSTDVTDYTPPLNNRVAFTIDDTAISKRCIPTTATSPNIYTEAVRCGFIACSPWFPGDIASFLNHQLTTATNIAVDSSEGTDGETPGNGYAFEFSRGRFQVRRTGGTRAFALISGTQTDAAYQYQSMQLNTGTGDWSSATNTNTTNPTHCPNGYAGKNVTLMGALGLGTGTQVARTHALDSTGAQIFGVRGAQDGFAARFVTSVSPAFYTPATLATSVAQAMNGTTLAATAADPAGSNLASVAQFLFVDSTGCRHAVTFTAGRRTPFQLAESLGFQLSRLDKRGVYHAPTGAMVNNALLTASGAQSAGGAAGTVFYAVSYDAATGKFTFTNHVITSYAFANTSGAQHSPLVDNGAFDTDPVRLAFQLDFRKTSLPSALATALGVSAFNPTLAASVLGFVGERVYEGTTIVSPAAAPAAALATTLSRGLAGDNTVTTRPFEQTLSSGNYTFCEQDYGGSGPENYLFPRWTYAFSSAAFNNKTYALTAARPPVPRSPFSSSGAGAGLQVTVSTVANGIITTLATSPAAAGEGYSVHDVVSVTGGKALAVVQYVNSSGGVLQVGLLYGGDGLSGSTYTAGSVATTVVMARASRALRIVDGQAEAQNDATDAVSTVIVQAAAVSENLRVATAGVASGVEMVGGTDTMAHRSTQSSLGASIGDVVTLGFCGKALRAGSTDKGATTTFDITSAVNGVIVTMSAFTDSNTGNNECNVGDHYVVLQGNHGTVLRCTGADGTNPTFTIVRRGTGHFVDTGVSIFGPVPLNTTGVVIDIVQPTYRRTAAAQSDLSTQFLMRQSGDPAFGTYTQNSYHRDGSMVKLRLAERIEFVEPGNCDSFTQLDEPRFQILNAVDDEDKFHRRDDTVWPILGQLDDSSAATSLQLQTEWNMDKQNSLFLALEQPRGDGSHTYTVGGKSRSDILTKISYNTQLNKQFGMLHSQRVRKGELRRIKLRLLDHKLNTADINSFTISFNVAELQ
jgi:hypothetical protein